MNTTSPTRVLIVDDHPVVREGLRSMLTCDEVEVVAEADNGADAVRLTREHVPDVVLLDMQLPDMEGVIALRRIKALATPAEVLVLSMHDDPALVRRVIDSGAAGYLLKGISRRDLIAALRAVSEGASVIDPSLLRGILSETPGPARERPSATATEALTAVERQVLELVANGLTNREIGERMRWSVATAKKYVQRILEKLDVSDRTQAVVSAMRRGLLD